MASITTEFTWLRQLLAYLSISHPQATKFFCDNQATLYIAANPLFHERTKHIELDFHLIRDKILDGSIQTSHVPTTSQLADIFTKSLPSYLLSSHFFKMEIINIYSPFRGGIRAASSTQHS